MNFILAEAAERGLAGLTAAQAKGYYEAGIRASMDQWGVTNSTAINNYIASAPVAYQSGTPGLTRIAQQKWIALFSDGGTAWAAVLDVADKGDIQDPRLGAAVATAAELGYHAFLTTVDCDEGARQALGLPATAQRYVTVYFGSRSDAETFAAAVPKLAVRTVEVRTRCVHP